MFRITTPGHGYRREAAPAPGSQARGEIPTPTIGRILPEHGYSTSWLGKDHNVPAIQASQTGPFDPRPIGTGFEHSYGFVVGDANRTTAARRCARGSPRTTDRGRGTLFIRQVAVQRDNQSSG